MLCDILRLIPSVEPHISILYTICSFFCFKGKVEGQEKAFDPRSRDMGHMCYGLLSFEADA